MLPMVRFLIGTFDCALGPVLRLYSSISAFLFLIFHCDESLSLRVFRVSSVRRLLMNVSNFTLFGILDGNTHAEVV